MSTEDQVRRGRVSSCGSTLECESVPTPSASPEDWSTTPYPISSLISDRAMPSYRFTTSTEAGE